jgi:ATPase subunit of ABC transporter with duplicated ATPase domains
MAPGRSFSIVADAVSKAYGSLVVLSAVSVALGPGDRVGVIGPNGVGKSTLLRILAGVEPPDAGAVRRSPPSLAVGYLPQEHEVRPGETLVEFLARRTGVAAAERDVRALERSLGGDDLDAVQRYTDALERFGALGGHDLEARAARLCADLGLPAEALHRRAETLSGGQTGRAGLAAVLLARFDVFLLDEPTNDLDFDGLERLEAFVRGARDRAVALVSHDRAFLERTIDRVVELDEHSRHTTEHAGGWAAFQAERERAGRRQSEEHEAYVRERERLLARARAMRTMAVKGAVRAKHRPPDPDRALQHARIQGAQEFAKGVRAVQRRLERLEPVEKPWEGWRLRLSMSPATRASEVVVRLEHAVMRRGSFVLGPIDVDVGWGERLAVLGPNGSGKSTLLGALLGQVALASGGRVVGPSTVFGTLDQARAHLGSDGPLLDSFVRASGLMEEDARSLLAKFDLDAGDVSRDLAQLSPGERTRAILAVLSARGVNCLVLDEPTNHLDLSAIEQLESALAGYDGSLVLVTHDRRLLDAVRIDRRVRLSPPGQAR